MPKREGPSSSARRFRIWQDKDVLVADKFDIREGSGAVSGSGGVKASFTHKPKDKPAEERLEIGADRMAYFPEQRKIAFKGSCGLRTAALRMSSESLDIRFASEGSEMESLLAQGQGRDPPGGERRPGRRGRL